MLSKKITERRNEKRYAVTGRPKSSLTNDRGQHITFIIADVSPHGLGLIIEGNVDISDVLTLKIEYQPTSETQLTVKWTLSAGALDDDQPTIDRLLRVGLSVLDQSTNLVDILQAQPGTSLEDLS